MTQHLPAAPRPRARRILIAAAAAVVVLSGAAALLVAGGGESESNDAGGQAAIVGTDRDDVITASSGSDRINALRGDDHIDGGDGADVLIGGGGDDVFIGGEDDATDYIDCGPGKDLVLKLDTSDFLERDCETAGWTVRAPAPAVYENRISVTPTGRRGVVVFSARCRTACTGVLELRAPNKRELLASGGFTLPAGRDGKIVVTPSPRGEILLRTRRKVRVVLRASRDCPECERPPLLVNSGFTGFI